MSEHAQAVSIIAVDTGGTFTDVIAAAGPSLRVVKVPSTPADPAQAVLEGIRRITSDANDAATPENAADPDVATNPDEAATPSSVVGRRSSVAAGGAAAGGFTLIHGSTVATNALLERRGARVGLVTNAGFEDMIEIGRQTRPQLYALVGERPAPLVAAGDRHGVAGRLGPDGSEESPLDAAELASLAGRLGDVEAVAICLLHSYADPAHEHAVAAALEGLGVPVSVSAELLPEYREYERMATTVVNAYVTPLMDRYLGRLEAEAGATRVRIMGSAGGALPVSLARREAVQTVLSGPAGGVVGALEAGGAAGIRDIVTFDMGGTSTDVSLCPGAPLATREFAIAALPVAVPVIDIHTVGAGGGSLAWVDAGGALRVGPRSAGADPGPICYGRGGTQVTVTDAHVWLGRLPGDAFLGGESRLDRAAIEGPLRELADGIGATPDEAAEGVLAVADTAMEGALRVISVERGHDPAGFALVPFGGAAGLHAAGLAARLGIPRLLVPPDPGLLSAFGMLVSPVRKDVSRSVMLADADATLQRLESVFAELATQASAAMAEEGFEPSSLTLNRAVDARYHGQSYELRVPADGWREAFHRLHESRYGYARRDAVVEVVTLRVQATAPVRRPPERRLARARSGAPRGRTRDVVFRGRTLKAAVVPRDSLRAGHRLEGPAVVTEYSATLWIPPGWSAETLESASLLMGQT
ncbi:MAG TPA: hydantoinase/oxoprolinase family protein [Longimicrobiales bacterium]|nr:hydantoinase/oxoprolinase family protein [Longimicrobiales bacterium]